MSAKWQNIYLNGNAQNILFQVSLLISLFQRRCYFLAVFKPLWFTPTDPVSRAGHPAVLQRHRALPGHRQVHPDRRCRPRRPRLSSPGRPRAGALREGQLQGQDGSPAGYSSSKTGSLTLRGGMELWAVLFTSKNSLLGFHWDGDIKILGHKDTLGRKISLACTSSLICVYTKLVIPQ